MNYDLTELPMGKYIVCGEAMVQGNVYQARYIIINSQCGGEYLVRFGLVPPCQRC